VRGTPHVYSPSISQALVGFESALAMKQLRQDSSIGINEDLPAIPGKLKTRGVWGVNLVKKDKAIC